MGPARPWLKGKSKLGHWHRTFRDQLLSEFNESRIANLADLNIPLWA
jgi:hypothetical protein